jgi:hypothetical protein
VVSFSYWSIKPWFYIEEKLTVVLIIPSSWGSPTGPVRHHLAPPLAPYIMRFPYLLEHKRIEMKPPCSDLSFSLIDQNRVSVASLSTYAVRLLHYHHRCLVLYGKALENSTFIRILHRWRNQSDRFLIKTNEISSRLRWIRLASGIVQTRYFIDIPHSLGEFL